jgi:hypothetical protein
MTVITYAEKIKVNLCEKRAEVEVFYRIFCVFCVFFLCVFFSNFFIFFVFLYGILL